MDSASLFIGDPALRDAVGAALLSAQLEKRGGSSELPPPAYLSVQEVFLALCDAGLKEPFEAVRERLVSSKALKPGSGNSDDNSEPQDSEAVVNVAALLQGIGPREEAGEGTQASFAKPDNLLVVGYGEAMIRLAPMGTGNTDAIYGRGKPSGNAAFVDYRMQYLFAATAFNVEWAIADGRFRLGNGFVVMCFVGHVRMMCRYLRSIGGDEMNVCVAHTMLGNHAEFLTVLPSGPNGEYVANACVDQGMSTDRIRFVDDADVGVFWVIPTEKRVLYQRKYSAFWINQVASLLPPPPPVPAFLQLFLVPTGTYRPGCCGFCSCFILLSFRCFVFAAQTEEDFDWGAIFAPAKGLTKWLHATGITPLCGQVRFVRCSLSTMSSCNARGPFHCRCCDVIHFVCASTTSGCPKSLDSAH